MIDLRSMAYGILIKHRPMNTSYCMVGMPGPPGLMERWCGVEGTGGKLYY